MAQEAIVVSQAVDDYMREMEVSQPALLELHASMLSVQRLALWLPTCRQGRLSLCTTDFGLWQTSFSMAVHCVRARHICLHCFCSGTSLDLQRSSVI